MLICLVVFAFTAQTRICRAREETNKIHVLDLKTENHDGGQEYFFWDGAFLSCESLIEQRERQNKLKSNYLFKHSVAQEKST